MKRSHYAHLHARVCEAALLPLAIERMAAHCQVSPPSRMRNRLLSSAAAAAAALTTRLQARQVKRRKRAAAAQCARGQLFDRVLRRWSRGAREVMAVVMVMVMVMVIIGGW
jgi:hypothetical protein